MERRRKDWARSAIRSALESGSKSWGELLKNTDLSGGGLSKNLRLMIRDGVVGTEIDSKQKPPRTIYVLRKLPPIYRETPLSEEDAPNVDDLSAMEVFVGGEVENIASFPEDFYLSMADFAVVEGLLESSIETLFINPEPTIDPKRIGRPSIDWFEGSLEEAARLLEDNALRKAMAVGSLFWKRTFSGILVFSKAKGVSPQTQAAFQLIIKEGPEAWEKKVVPLIRQRLTKLKEDGVFRVMNKGAVGIVFFSLVDYIERERAQFEEKHGRKDPFRRILFSLMKLTKRSYRGDYLGLIEEGLIDLIKVTKSKTTKAQTKGKPSTK